MIPAEAVEAATDALIASKLGDHAGINGEEFVEAAMAALEAAAPHMLAAKYPPAVFADTVSELRMFNHHKAADLIERIGASRDHHRIS